MSTLWRLVAVVGLALAAAPAQEDSSLYYLVFLRPDPARKTIPADDMQRIQAAHMDNIRSMAKDGILVAAGPMDDKVRTISGVFVLRAPSLAEAQRIAERDPTVVEHRNTVDTHAWRGPKGIGEEYVRLHRENPNTPEGMGVQPLALLTRGAGWDGGAAQRALIAKLKAAGKLAAAGAVEGDDTLAGVLIFKRIPLDEAEALVKFDGKVEFHRWYCAEHVLPW